MLFVQINAHTFNSTAISWLAVAGKVSLVARHYTCRLLMMSTCTGIETELRVSVTCYSRLVILM